jgi:hypothetical protein
MEVADSFKPYLALMVLDDEDDFVRRNYLAWYEGTFNPAPTPSLATDGIDWALAGAVAMMVAHQQGDTVRHARFAMTLETHLGEMAKEILDLNEVEDDDDPVTLLTVAGAGASPLQHEEMKDEIGLSCGARSPRKLASEFHDKVGDWYGYMSTLALAWRHLLDGFNNPFTSVSGIVLPNLDTLNGWPEPKVPAAVIAEARLLPQRLLLPRRAISRSNPRPDGSADVALFVDPPARDVDNNVGHPPAPKGEISAFDFRGGLSRRVLRNDFPYPPLGEASPESDSWSQAPSFDFEENTLVERWDSQIDDTGLHLIVTLRAAELQWVPWRWGLWYPRFVLARLRGTVSLAWARQT